MAGKNLNILQAGKESVWGTAVTDTVKRMLIEDCSFTPIVESKRFQEIRGSMAPAYVAALAKTGGAFTYKGVVAYDDAPYELDAIFGTASPSGTGPYTYAYNGPLAAVVASPRIQTLYWGNSVDGVYKMPGAVAHKLHYSAKNQDALMFDVEGLGLLPVSGASFAALSDRNVTPVMAGDLVVSIDTWGGTIGSTTYNQVYSFDLVVETKRDLRYYLGSYAPTRYREPLQWEFTLKIVMEFMAASPNSKAQFDAILALTAGTLYNKQVRLKATNGTNIWQIDLGAFLEKSPVSWTYDANVQTLELEFKGQYNPTIANWIKGSIANSVSVMA